MQWQVKATSEPGRDSDRWWFLTYEWWFACVLVCACMRTFVVLSGIESDSAWLAAKSFPRNKERLCLSIVMKREPKCCTRLWRRKWGMNISGPAKWACATGFVCVVCYESCRILSGLSNFTGAANLPQCSYLCQQVLLGYSYTSL